MVLLRGEEQCLQDSDSRPATPLDSHLLDFCVLTFAQLKVRSAGSERRERGPDSGTATCEWKPSLSQHVTSPHIAQRLRLELGSLLSSSSSSSWPRSSFDQEAWTWSWKGTFGSPTSVHHSPPHLPFTTLRHGRHIRYRRLRACCSF